MVLASAACGAGRAAPELPPSPREAVIADLQDFQSGLGVARTGNFQRFDGTRPAVYRCYYTGLLELPASYTELGLLSPDEPACPIDETEFDVFFYAIEAVASGDSPVSPALVEAPIERTLVVVPHEDFHNQPEAEQALLEVAEGAATLVGFLTARDYALARYGADSFNTCPAALNNAGLAFDRTYTQHYPTWFELHDALDAGTAATVAAFKAILAADPRTEAELRAAGRAYLAAGPVE
jgi:hypothetical protein